jgi:formylglycine-generating enzyme required for sulfatase activity
MPGRVSLAALLVFLGGCDRILGISPPTTTVDSGGNVDVPAATGDASSSRDGLEGARVFTGAGFPSCQGLPANCGPDRNESCCTTITVPGGSFHPRQNFGEGAVAVRSFALDKYEVTVGRFRTFVAAYDTFKPAIGDGAMPDKPDSGWRSEWSTSLTKNVPDRGTLETEISCGGGSYTLLPGVPAEHEKLPMGCLRLEVAYAFCIWDGGRLPSLIEWNYVAAGGALQRPYPWSPSGPEVPPDATRARYGCTEECNASKMIEVGALPLGNGLWGHSDLAGNVWEWLRDSTTTNHSNAGGSVESKVDRLSTENAYEGWFADTGFARQWTFGVRCARAPQP